MNNFTVIYKILSALEKSMDFENFDAEQISPEKLGITKERRDKLLVEMQREGYITGIAIKKWISSPAHIELDSPCITIKGLEYLAENSMMKKACATLKGIAELIP